MRIMVDSVTEKCTLKLHVHAVQVKLIVILKAGFSEYYMYLVRLHYTWSMSGGEPGSSGFFFKSYVLATYMYPLLFQRMGLNYI
jgi:hypothetical protein